MNVFRPRFCTAKAILGRGQLGRMGWILLWIMPLMQERSLDLLISSPAHYHCTTAALSSINNTWFVSTVKFYMVATTWSSTKVQSIFQVPNARYTKYIYPVRGDPLEMKRSKKSRERHQDVWGIRWLLIMLLSLNVIHFWNRIFYSVSSDMHKCHISVVNHRRIVLKHKIVFLCGLQQRKR